jgi:hypothetical protein
MLSAVHDASRDRWFSNTSVTTIATAVVGEGNPRLVRWAKEAILTDTTATVSDEFGLGAAPSLLAAARRIASAGASILSEPHGELVNLRGAVLERIVYELVALRGASPVREQGVVLHQYRPARVSPPKEVVVDDDPFEAYECKRKSGRLDQPDLDQLEELRVSALTIGRAAAVGVATLDSWRALELAVAHLTIPGSIRHLCQSDLLELGDAPARRRLAGMAADHRF